VNRPCLERGCRSLTSKGSRCEPCTKALQRARDAARGTSTARGYDGTYVKNRAAVLATGDPCHWCGAKATTADHVLPLSRGGNSDIGNLKPSCSFCNYSRGARMRPSRT
jgi:5-methylcytosine-specific restriction endonuclease McrA